MSSSNFIPYGRQDVSDEDVIAVVRALSGDFLTTGPEVAGLERDFCSLSTAPHAVVSNSGTAALHLAALALGLGPGDKAIVPSITFLATANAVRMTGADVVFADVDSQTGLITLETAQAAFEKAGSATKAIFPVHLGGQPTDPAIYQWAKSVGLSVIADSCHAIGGWYKGDAGKVIPVGSCVYEDLATFSFHPVKTVAMGEGGLTSARSADHAAIMQRMRNHGMTRDVTAFEHSDMAFDPDTKEANSWYYEMPDFGFNYRAPDILCALGRSQLARLGSFHARRAVLAERYDAAFADLAGRINLVPRVPYAVSGWHLYRLNIDFDAIGLTRAGFMAALREKGVGSQVHYIPVNDQPYYRSLYGRADLPGAQRYYQQTLSIPLYSALSDADQGRVIAAIRGLVS